MKRKVLTRILSCAMTGLLLMESPLQVAAEDMSGIEAASAPETPVTDDSPSTEVNEEETPISDLKLDQEKDAISSFEMEQDEKQTLELNEGAEDVEDNSTSELEQSPAENVNETEIQEETEDDASTEEGVDSNSEKEDVETNELNNSNELEVLSDSFILESLDETSDPEKELDISNYETELGILEDALEDKTEAVDLSSNAMPLELLQDLLLYILEDDKIETNSLSPKVDYTYILDNDVRIVQNVNLTYVMVDAPSVTAQVKDLTGILLTWNAIEGIENYEIYRAEADDEENYELLETVAAEASLEYRDESVMYGNTYLYRVEAVTTVEGKSFRSKDVEAVKIKAEANAPENLSAVGLENAVKLTWDEVDGATGYEVETLDSSTGEYVFLNTTEDSEYSHEGLESETSYVYRVRAIRQFGRSKAGYSTYTDSVAVMTKAVVQPLAEITVPVLSAVSLQALPTAYNQIKLDWDRDSQATGYEIERRTDSGSYEKIADISSGSTITYLDGTVETDKTYIYRIRSYSKVGQKTYYGGYSSEKSGKTVLETAAISAVATSNSQSLNISWSQVAGATGYEIYRSQSSGSDYTLINSIADANVTNYQDNGLTIGDTYYYQVRAYRSENGRTSFAGFSTEAGGTVKLSEVTGLTVTMTKSTTLELNWNPVSDAKTYEVYYSTSPDSGYKRLTSTKKTFYRFSRAKCGLTYYFRIRTYEKIGKVKYYSDDCAVVSGMTTLTGIPEVYTSKVTYNSITIKWNRVKDAKKYEIYYSTSPDGEYQFLKSQGGTNFTHKKLVTGENYYYQVRAIRDFYYSDLSSSVSARPVLGELKGLKVATGDSQLKLSWKKLTGAENYVILRADAVDGTYQEVGRTNKTSYTDKGLNASTTYYYQVYAVAGSYQTNILGPIGQTTKAPKPVDPAPSGPTNSSSNKKRYYGVDVSSYQGKIDWGDVADDGIDFAMIRILTGKGTSNLSLDSRFEYNYEHARRNGIKVGVYRYSYATTKSGARSEAMEVIDALDGRKLDYPVVLDMEDNSVLNGTTRAKRTEIIKEYKKIVERAGYKFALYANKNWLDNYIEPEALEGVDIWFARWRSLDKGHGYSGPGNLTMWQYSDSGSVDGISGPVDLDISYKNY